MTVALVLAVVLVGPAGFFAGLRRGTAQRRRLDEVMGKLIAHNRELRNRLTEQPSVPLSPPPFGGPALPEAGSWEDIYFGRECLTCGGVIRPAGGDPDEVYFGRPPRAAWAHDTPGVDHDPVVGDRLPQTPLDRA